MPTKVINKQCCPACGQSVNEREIALFADLVTALIKVFDWCESHGKRNFTRKEIKHLFKNENQSARFGDWIYFGEIVMRKTKGSYVLNRELAEEFFRNRLRIPSRVKKNPLTNKITVLQNSTIAEIKSLGEQLNRNSDFIARYYGKQEINQ